MVLAHELPKEELDELTNSLKRLSLKVELREDIPADRLGLERQNHGPWFD